MCSWSLSASGFCAACLKLVAFGCHLTNLRQLRAFPRTSVTQLQSGRQRVSIPTTTNISPDVNQSLFPNERSKVPYNGLCVGAPEVPSRRRRHVRLSFFVWRSLRAFPTEKPRGTRKLKHVPFGTAQLPVLECVCVCVCVDSLSL